MQVIAGREPWVTSIENLKRTLRELNDNYRTVASAGPQRLRAALDQDLRVQSRLPEANAMVQQTVPMAQNTAGQDSLNTFSR